MKGMGFVMNNKIFNLVAVLNETFKEQIGVFEGGGYLSKGIYRPMNNCMMRNYHPFCPACQRGITQMINFLTDRPVK